MTVWKVDGNKVLEFEYLDNDEVEVTHYHYPEGFELERLTQPTEEFEECLAGFELHCKMVGVLTKEEK